MWFHTNYFVPAKQFYYDTEEIAVKAASFTCSGEKIEK